MEYIIRFDIKYILFSNGLYLKILVWIQTWILHPGASHILMHAASALPIIDEAPQSQT